MVNNKKWNQEYYLLNKEKIKLYQQTPIAIKTRRISHWKDSGVKSDNYDLLYEYYLSITKCENCNIILTEDKQNTRTTKCLDHDHLTGDFRKVLCNACNVCYRVTNKSGIPNIFDSKKGIKRWRYQKKISGVIHTKLFLTKEEAILYKEEYEASLYAQNPT